MLVKITKEHTEGTIYTSFRDCPLARAIKEQHPEFPLDCVLGLGIYTKEGHLHQFNYDHWNYFTLQDLKEGRLTDVLLEIDDDYIEDGDWEAFKRKHIDILPEPEEAVDVMELG